MRARSPTMRAHWLVRCLLVFGLVAACGLAAADELNDLLSGKAADKPAPVDRVISAESSTRDDEKIARRLRQIYTEIDVLQGIAIDVNGGIVTLSGKVDSAASEDRAVQFARQVEGVIDVENTLAIDRDLQPRLQKTLDKVIILGRQLLAGLPLFLLAVVVFVLFWWFGRWLAARRALFRRVTPNYFIATLLGQLVQLVFFVLGIVAALVLLDATALLGTILGAAGIIGLAVGFAVRDTVENYIASILLSLRNPFEVNDFVDIDGHEGSVVKLTARATILLSPDGNHIRIPNATVFKAVIVNYTRHPERRFQFDVGVDTGQDLVAAQDLALHTLLSVTGVLGEPQPMVMVQTLGDSNVVLRCFAWVNQREYSFGKVRSEAIRMLKQAFDAAGVLMPEPAYRLRVLGAMPGVADAGDGPPDAAPVVPAVMPIDTGDVSLDHTIEEKIAQEERLGADDNLLSDDAPREL